MKRLLLGIISTFLIMAISTISQAVVTGVCSNCHTMHNSQNGQPVARGDEPWGLTGGSGEAIPQLLIASCLGCHSSVGTNSIETFDGNKIPIVYNTSQPANPLAGGNFYYVISDDTKGHNVVDIKGPDQMGLTPPGYSGTWTSQLTCAGTWGCHGFRGESIDKTQSFAPQPPIKGAHHEDDSIINGASVGKSYRFLDGILGKEDGDWEQDNINTSHNEYKGSRSYTTTTETMSSLCAQCHPSFHGTGSLPGGDSIGIDSDGQSPWFRHPIDIVLPSEGEYQYYNGGPGGTGAAPYSMVAPLARPDLQNVTDTSKINPGTDIVMCLSCHRAHASPYFKLMRWDYRGWPGAEPFGCAICHTSKD